jgi:LysR family glycine cleavage system transcriptional activator
MSIAPLPPLSSLVYFDAAARHCSLSGAAAELQVTPSAVSRQVMRLEEFLGRPLFMRKKGKVQLTPVGQEYAEKVHGLLTDCADFTGRQMKSSGPRNLTIACAAGTSALWLAPRMHLFRAVHPEIRVRIIIQESVRTLSTAAFDVAMYYFKDALLQDLDGEKVIDENVHAYCSPAYLDGARLPPSALLGKTLLVAEDQQRQWLQWHDWFNLCGVADPKFQHTIASNHYPILAQMATQGQGIVLGWEKMIDPLVVAGKLVKASDACASYGGGYYVVWPITRRQSQPSRLFKEWVQSEIDNFSFAAMT